MSDSGDLVDRWRSGDQAAARELHHRYAVRLCRLAERQLDQRLGRRVEADDIVQSVFRTFFRRTEQGEYPIEDSGSLWSLFVQITLNKVRKQSQRHRAKKRDIRRETYPDADPRKPEWLARDPTPEEASLLIDELESLLNGLRDPEPEIIRLCLEGHSTSDIAASVGCTRWTIRRVLNRIGNRLHKRRDGAFEK